MKRKISKKKCLTFLLVYFIFFTSYFSVITFSKYVGVIRDATASTPIAKWDVSMNTGDNDDDYVDVVIGNSSDSFIVTVTSISEIKANYSIVLTNVPSSLRIKLDNGIYKSPVNNKITFDNAGSINANATNRTVNHTLTFDVPINSDTITNNIININVIFTQANPSNN